MKFAHYDLGQQILGRILQVMLAGGAADVSLLDGSDSTAFKAS